MLRFSCYFLIKCSLGCCKLLISFLVLIKSNLILSANLCTAFIGRWVLGVPHSTIFAGVSPWVTSFMILFTK